LFRLLMSVALVPISKYHNMTFRNPWPCSLFYKRFKKHRAKKAEERFNFEVKLLSCTQFSPGVWGSLRILQP
jgi:hypothetical protein